MVDDLVIVDTSLLIFRPDRELESLDISTLRSWGH